MTTQEQAEEEKIIVCVEWDKRSLPSERYTCLDCGCDVAISVRNTKRVEADGILPICAKCAQLRCEEAEEFEIGGALVGGQVYTDISKGLAAAMEEVTGVPQESREVN